MVCNPLHSNQTVVDGIHIIHAFIFPFAADRLAFVPTAADIGKVALQLSDESFYLLTSITPVSWTAICGSAVGTHGGLPGLLEDDHPQYLRIDGYRAMDGILRMDGYAIECVGGMDMKGDINMDGYDLLNVGEINNQQFYGPRTADPPTGADPLPEDGDLYYNVPIGELMFYDESRSKWLSTKTITVQSGRNGNTQTGVFYRGLDGMVLDASDRGLPVPAGTLVSIALTKTSTGASTLEVLANGAVIATLFHSGAAGTTRNDTIDADFSAGLLSFRNISSGSATRNVQIVAQVRRRA